MCGTAAAAAAAARGRLCDDHDAPVMAPRLLMMMDSADSMELNAYEAWLIVPNSISPCSNGTLPSLFTPEMQEHRAGCAWSSHREVARCR